jgi:tripartite-type tricarboxylate transporter receptor subunit TctC
VALTDVRGADGDRYPSRPIRIVVPTSPSGGTDFIARLYSQKLSEAVEQSVIVDNRPGATGLIGLEVVSTAAPDGYTLIVLNIGHILAGILANRPTMNMSTAFAPVSILASYPTTLVVHPSLPARSLRDFIALARSQPGKLMYASGGIAGLQHMATELFRREAGIELVHVPYKGTTPGLVDLVAGNVHLTMCSIPPALPFIKAGKLRTLAMTGRKRAAALPDVPTFFESGLRGVVFEPWFGVLAPAKTPDPIVDRLHTIVTEATNTPEVNAKISSSGLDPVSRSRADFEGFYSSERVRWLKIAHDAGIR